MNFNTTNNNAKDRNLDVNTRAIQFSNKDGFVPSTLVLGYWNDMLTIKFHPALPADKQTENKIFDYEQSVSTALTLEKLVLIENKIDEVITPAIKEGKNTSVGVQVGGDSLLVISTGNAEKNVGPYLAIHKNLDENTKKPNTSMYYEFKTNFTVDNYNEENGSYTVSDSVLTELLLFIKSIKAAVVGLTSAVAHSVRYGDRFTNEKRNNTMNAMASKLGVESGNGYGKKYNNNSNSGGNLFGRPSSAFTPASSNDNDMPFGVSTTDDITDLEKFMG